MKSSIKRRLVALVSVSLLGALPVLSAAPAAANEEIVADLSCTRLLNTTPGIEADINGDGTADVRAPRIYDVDLCGQVRGSLVTYPPRVDNCSSTPKSVRCMAVRITVLPAYASATVEAALCFSIEGVGRSCEPVTTGDWAWTAPVTMCVGYDLDGGHPCANGTMFALE